MASPKHNTIILKYEFHINVLLFLYYLIAVHIRIYVQDMYMHIAYHYARPINALKHP